MINVSGLNTGLKPKFYLKTPKQESETFEIFLAAVERTLLKEAFQHRRSDRTSNKRHYGGPE